jgi:hypothetical protein
MILKSKKKACDLTISWITGIDVGCILTEHGETIQSFIEETKEGGAMQGGPMCKYIGKTVPCFVGSSPYASITSQLLADMLKFMDNLQLFHQDDGNSPFILLDGHPSRLQKLFQEYVNDPTQVECLYWSSICHSYLADK